MIIIFFLYNIAFAYLFYKIWFLYGMIVPIIFSSVMFFLFGSSPVEKESNMKKNLKKIAIQNIVYIIWIIINIWIFIIANYTLQTYFPEIYNKIDVIFGIIFFNIIIWLISCIGKWREIIKASYITIIIATLYLINPLSPLEQLKIFTAITLSVNVVYQSLYFAKTQKILPFTTYGNFFLLIIIFVLLINKYIISHPISLGLVIQIGLLLMLIVIKKLRDLKHNIINLENTERKIQKEKELFWYSDIDLEKFEKYRKYIKHKSNIAYILDYFEKSPIIFKAGVSLLNVLPIIIQSYIFITYIGQWQWVIYEIIYIIGTIIFFLNFLIFKQLKRFYYIQRFIAFFIINFIVYALILYSFGENLTYIVIWGISWNLLNTLWMFMFSNSKNGKDILQKIDHILWLSLNFVWLSFNIYVLFKLWIDRYLTWGISILYIGIYLFICRYIILSLWQKPSEEDSSETDKPEQIFTK